MIGREFYRWIRRICRAYGRSVTFLFLQIRWYYLIRIRCRRG